MKKLLLILISFCFIFSGCGTVDQLEKISQDLNLYTIDAEIDTNTHTISAHERVLFKNRTGTKLENICFHLYPNAFRTGATTTKAVSNTQFEKAYPNGFDEGNITIGALNVNNEVCGFEIGGADQNILIVSLAKALEDGMEATIDMDFLTLIPNVNHRFGYGEHTINCGNFYPVLCVFEDGEWDTGGYSPNGDPFYSELANFDVTIKYPSEFTLVSTGEQTIMETNEISTSTCTAKCVRDFAFILSKDFECVSQEVDNTQVNYFYYDETDPQSNLKVCVDALNTFNNMIGEYPYKVLNVCKSNFLQGGMEYPNLVFISDAVDVDSEYKNIIVHEIGHQWFYGVVGNDEHTYPWLDEALTEYITALFYDKNEGYEKTTESVLSSALSSYLLFCDMYREVYGELDTSINRSIYDFKTEAEYTYLTYVKGILMFDSISEIVGKNKMEKCIKNYYIKNAFKNAKPKDLIKAFESASQKPLASYINSWLDGSVVLEELGR